MHQPIHSLSHSELNLLSTIPWALSTQLMNGCSTFLLSSWPKEFSTPLYLSGVRALHTGQGFPDPLANCLHFQRVVFCINCCQGSLSSSCLLITDDLMLAVSGSLSPRSPHVLGCLLPWILGLLHTSEFTVLSLASFSLSLHLGVQDITAVDSLSAPLCMPLKINGLKTDPFRKGACIHIGLSQTPLCAVHSVMTYLSSRGDIPGPLFLFQHGQPLSHSLLTDWLWQILASVNFPGNFSSHSFLIKAATVAACN